MKTYLELLERECGHILVLTSLLVLCIIISLYLPDNSLISKTADMVLGALLLAMRGPGGKPDASQKPPTDPSA